MSRPLSIALSFTDIAFLLYWLLAGLSTAGIVSLPPEWMYANHDQPDVIAWNWSFFPMDLAFSYFGLRAVAAARQGREIWRPYAIVSLTLTMAAGGMAVSYWVLMKEFNPSWFFANLALVIWPLFFMPRLLAESAANRSAPSAEIS